MSSEIRLAFAHPAERSEATGDAFRDRISLRDHIREVEIGAFQEERGATQRLCFNVVVEVRLSDEIADDVDKILSYDRITDAINRELSIERLNLLETLAERVAEDILSDPRAGRVFVRIEKLDRGPGALGVEIVRDRAGVASPPEPVRDLAPPQVLYLDRAAVDHPELGQLLDRLLATGRAAILCVGQTGQALAPVRGKLVARRIGLLDIELEAWRLADRDPRCVVVDTRTELEHAMRGGQIAVWAPSKLVLDAPPGQEPGETDPQSLARWLAREFQAEAPRFVTGDRNRAAPFEDLVSLLGRPVDDM